MVSAHPDDKRGDADDLVGAVIGERYRVSALVGRGGMGSVYRATDESLGRDVALKILRSIPGDEAAIGCRQNNVGHCRHASPGAILRRDAVSTS